MLAEELQENGEDVGIESNGFGHGMRAGVGFESGVTDGEGQSAHGEAGFAQSLAGFLRKMTEQRFHFGRRQWCLRRRCDCARWIWVQRR